MATHGITHHGTIHTTTTTGGGGIIIITITWAIGIDQEITMVIVLMAVEQVLPTTTQTDQADRLTVAVKLQAQDVLQLVLLAVEDV